MIYNISVKFDEWITRKYVEWRGSAIGRERTVTEFAAWIGVSQSLMTQWMMPDGKIPRSVITVSKLAAKFGIEVYEVLGINPQPLDRIIQLISQLPPDAYFEVIKAIEAIREDFGMTDISSLNINNDDQE